jgi:hypothetical protein
MKVMGGAYSTYEEDECITYMIGNLKGTGRLDTGVDRAVVLKLILKYMVRYY